MQQIVDLRGLMLRLPSPPATDRSTTQRSRPVPTVRQRVGSPSETQPGTHTVQASVEGLAQTTVFNATIESLEFDFSVPVGINLIHIPLQVTAVDGAAQTIESISDLYNALGGASTVNFLHHL